MLKIISQYSAETYLNYLRYLDNQSNHFIYKSSEITIRVVYYTFSDKSITIEMCNND